MVVCQAGSCDGEGSIGFLCGDDACLHQHWWKDILEELSGREIYFIQEELVFWSSSACLELKCE